MPYLSIIVPAYNESKTIETIINKLQKLKLPENYEKEIIVVNDCSQDSTPLIIEKFSKTDKSISLLNNSVNLGKSQTVKRGILASKGEFVVIQDADLEYNPEDIVFIFEAMLKNKVDVGYGDRFGKYNNVIYSKNFYGNLLISFISNLFTIRRIKVNIPDMEVCYKIIRGDVARKIAKEIISTSNFGFEPEVTARLSKYKINQKFLKFIVLPIDYFPRSYADGKKMKAFRDGFKALVEIFRFNLF